MWGVTICNKFYKNVNLQKSLIKLFYSIGEVWERWDGLLKDQYSPLLWLGFS